MSNKQDVKQVEPKVYVIQDVLVKPIGLTINENEHEGGKKPPLINRLPKALQKYLIPEYWGAQLSKSLYYADFFAQVYLTAWIGYMVFSYLISSMTITGMNIWGFSLVILFYLTVACYAGKCIYQNHSWFKNMGKARLNHMLTNTSIFFLKQDVTRKSKACLRWKRKAKTLHNVVRSLREEVAYYEEKTYNLAIDLHEQSKNPPVLEMTTNDSPAKSGWKS